MAHCVDASMDPVQTTGQDSTSHGIGEDAGRV
jgi:hypothetical protein